MVKRKSRASSSVLAASLVPHSQGAVPTVESPATSDPEAPIRLTPAQLHDDISKSVVRITIRPPLLHPNAFKRTRLYGIIVVLESNFAYVVAHPKYFDGKLGGARLRIRFQGHAALEFDAPEIHWTPNICGICCRNPAGYNINLIKEATLCATKLEKSQEVHVYDPESELITSGSITGITGPKFQNNCAASDEAGNGAVVITNKREMVGLCTTFQNLYLTAISAEAIMSEIDTYQGRQFTSIKDALQRLRNYN